jgi:hypothetical protein
MAAMQSTAINTGAPTSHFQEISYSLHRIASRMLQRSCTHTNSIDVLYLCTCQAFLDLLYFYVLAITRRRYDEAMIFLGA